MSHRSSPRPASMGRRRIAGYDEEDVHTGWYRVMSTYKRSRQRSKIKRLGRRRERAEARRALLRELSL
jgi:hypothetical protein